ncbi:MAG: hypothetical protein M3R31_05385 [Pseudomonadota bacterium]|nr:hypothetical protein [Pseudomonadota bacterium]
MNDRIALLLATRKRPDKLLRALESFGALAARVDKLVAVIGIDDDDEESIAVARTYAGKTGVLWSIAPRELTLGHLWNRLARLGHACDILALSVDDYVMRTEGWDEGYRSAVSLMPKGYGTAFPADPLHPGRCTLPVITRRLMDRMGFFVPPWFPFWFHDSWLGELGSYIACLLPVAVAVDAPDGRGATNNIRDLAFWSELFEATRPMRVDVAKGLIEEMYANQPGLLINVFNNMPGVVMHHVAVRQRVMLKWAKDRKLDEIASVDVSPRYREAKRRAEGLLAQLQRPA